MRCEDYPCCGHTDGLPCDWTYTPEARAYDIEHAYCDHAAGFCDHEDLWSIDDERRAVRLEDQGLDGSYED